LNETHAAKFVCVDTFTVLLVPLPPQFHKKLPSLG